MSTDAARSHNIRFRGLCAPLAARNLIIHHAVDDDRLTWSSANDNDKSVGRETTIDSATTYLYACNVHII